MAQGEGFPSRVRLRRAAAWCKENHGSIVGVAALVRRRDGGIGVHYSMVSRTLRGRERSLNVMKALYRYADNTFE